MVTPGRERQAAMAERRRAAGLVRVGGWVPASRKAEALAFLAGASVCANTTPLAIEAEAAPSAQTGVTLLDALREAIAATRDEDQPEPDEVRFQRALFAVFRVLDDEGLRPQAHSALAALFGGPARAAEIEDACWADIRKPRPRRRKAPKPAKPAPQAPKKTDSDEGGPIYRLPGQLDLIDAPADTTSASPAPTDQPATDPASADITSPEPVPAEPASETASPVPFGQRLRAAREAAGLSQKKLADLAEVCPSLPGHWETGRRTPAPDIMQKIVEILGIEP